MDDKRVLYLGDIHGEFRIVNRYLKKYDLNDCIIIQVGDFGVGFSPFIKEKRALKMINDQLVKRNVTMYVIRGNHDFKPYFDKDPFEFSNIRLLPDYTILNIGGKKTLFVGGGISVDRTWRYTKEQRNGNHEPKPGQVWWEDEEFILDVDKITEMKGIEIVVTHTAPSYCPIDNSLGLGAFVNGIIKDTGDVNLSKDLLYERQQMTELFFLLKMNGNVVETHYYGHFHKSDTLYMNGIRHRLLNTNELYEDIKLH